jgi:16S rRNA (cytosine967-C5)-methyltransferase
LAKKNQLSARALAAQIISHVLKQEASLTTLFEKQLSQLAESERGLCQQLCYGVLRWQPKLDAISNKLLNKPLKRKDLDILALIYVGLYQLSDMRVPSHAAISETVNACLDLNKKWAKGLINACLRNYQRQQDEITASLDNDDLASYAHPQWLIDLIQQNWPENWQQILLENNQQAPMYIRVNKQKVARDAYSKLLDEADITHTLIPLCGEGIALNSAVNVLQLPNFEQGFASVQDGAAQITVSLLQLDQQQHVLDACAAPGGKSCHILEHEPSTSLTSIDIDASRLEQIEENLARLDLRASLIAADAAQPETWWDKQKFDRILIDAPCSGTGVIRRHPDIKYLRREEDIQQLAIQQHDLLEQLWPLLKDDGLLIYITCSILKEENEHQIRDFLQRHPEAKEFAPSSLPATKVTHGYQRFPGDDGLDGFYYACLCRR